MKPLDRIHFRIWRQPCTMSVFRVFMASLLITSLLCGIVHILNDISTTSSYDISHTMKVLIKEQLEPLKTEHTQQNEIRQLLVGPSAESYQFLSPIPVRSHVLERAVRQIRNLTTRGTFVEVGAGDGELRSPTLCLEMEDGWTGLLIESNPQLFERLKEKNRKAYLSPTCVGFFNYSYQGNFVLLGGKSYLLPDDASRKAFPSNSIPVQCFPLYDHLVAFGSKTIDFLVLNINGNELEVLKSLPWDSVDIKIIAVSFTNQEWRKTAEYLERFDYIRHKSYLYAGEMFTLFVKRFSGIIVSETDRKTVFHFGSLSEVHEIHLE